MVIYELHIIFSYGQLLWYTIGISNSTFNCTLSINSTSNASNEVKLSAIMGFIKVLNGVANLTITL